MLLVQSNQSIDFLKKHNLGIELATNKEEGKIDLEAYAPFVKTVHLPYSDANGFLNLGAFDDAWRLESIECIKKAIDMSVRYNVTKAILHPCCFLEKEHKKVGEYSRMIDSMREIFDYAAKAKLVICLENQVLRHPDIRVIVGTSAAEWRQLPIDIGKSNVSLCLDTSHASSVAAHEETPEARIKVLWDFFKEPDNICHFHWSDAKVLNGEAKYQDMHLVPGMGDIPLEFHKAIAMHPGSKLLEQRSTEEACAAGLAFIASLTD